MDGMREYMNAMRECAARVCGAGGAHIVERGAKILNKVAESQRVHELNMT
jgi:hypothetical protein